MRLQISSVVLAAALAGCATPTIYDNDPALLGKVLMETGQYQLALNVLTKCAQQGNSACWNNLGVMYQSGYIGTSGPDIPQAIAHYSMAARYGLPVAQQNLVALGATVPSADLAVLQYQQQVVQQQQAAQQMQLAGQLGSLLGCAAAGGNCTQVAPTQAPTPAPAMPKACSYDFECGTKGVCMKSSPSAKGICAVR